jgi:hypothetical protein
MDTHVNSARDGDRTRASRVRRRQLHYSDGQLARRALALRRVNGPRRAIYRPPLALLRSAACQPREASALPNPHGPNGSDRRRSTFRAQQ